MTRTQSTTRRNLFCIGAAAAVTATARPAAAMAATGSGADAELFALLAEEERLWSIVSRLQDEAQLRERAIPEGRVEIGRQIIRGRVEPIYATTDERLAEVFDREPDSPQLAELNRIVDIQTDLYLDRRDELLSVIREQAAARAEALQAAGVDELEARAEGYTERASIISGKINGLRPKTIEGAIALLDDGGVGREEQAIAGLREIAKREAQA